MKKNKTKRVLVADDDADNVDSLVMLLRARGLECFAATSGSEALDLANEVQPDIVVLDLAMAAMNGNEVCREIRSTPWGKNTLVIAVSGWTGKKHEDLAIAAGFNAYMRKPIDLEELYAALEI